MNGGRSLPVGINPGFIGKHGIHPQAKSYVHREIVRGKPDGPQFASRAVALNRFGFGARGGASGDFINAASDPRGFVKAELARPNGALLEVPGLASTPALGKAVFDYQFEIQQARDAAAKSRRTAAPPRRRQPPPDAKAQRRNLSLNSIAMEMAPKEPRRRQPPESADAA